LDESLRRITLELEALFQTAREELDEASKQLHHKVVNVARTVMNYIARETRD
jgi:hypothetical protein